jgi:hypothetical protein
MGGEILRLPVVRVLQLVFMPIIRELARISRTRAPAPWIGGAQLSDGSAGIVAIRR